MLELRSEEVNDVLHEVFWMLKGKKVVGITANNASRMTLEFEDGLQLEFNAVSGSSFDEDPILVVNKLVEREEIRKVLHREKIF